MSGTAPRVMGGAQASRNQRPVPVSNEVSLTIGTKIWSGWTAVRIGRGIERFPSDFEVALTERYPGQAGTFVARPGDPCVLKIGADVLITGRIDRYTAGIGPKGHEVRINGRSLCRALVDCMAGRTPDGQWLTFFKNTSIFDIAYQLARLLGVKVISRTNDADVMAPDIFLNLGETVYEVIERVCRWAGLLILDDVNGNMVLANEGTQPMASGFVEGVNVEQAQAQFTSDQRFSDYIVLLMSVDAFSQSREAMDGSINGNEAFEIKDPSAPALDFRPTGIITEQPDQDLSFARKRAVNEMNRRNGHSRQITVTTDTWRDKATALWEPNRLVKVNLPLLKVADETFVIGEVTYRLDESGTHCDLVLMPQGAYAPQPLNLQPINKQVADALKGGAQKNAGSSRLLQNPTGSYDSSAQGRGDL